MLVSVWRERGWLVAGQQGAGLSSRKRSVRIERGSGSDTPERMTAVSKWKIKGRKCTEELCLKRKTRRTTVMTWNGGEFGPAMVCPGARSAVRWPSRSPMQMQPSLLAGSSFPNSHIVDEAGAPESIHQIRVRARCFCFWVRPGHQETIATQDSSSSSSVVELFNSSSGPLGVWKVLALIMIILRAKTLHLHLHLRAPLAFGTVPHHETSGVEPGVSDG